MPTSRDLHLSTADRHAQVAKEAAAKFNPNVKLEAYHANIKDTQFNIEWFQTFNLVFNALDNLDARRHVNKMCLAADVPLIESGTMGFNGQVQVIKKGKTECYDCNPKEVPKSFPVCTIRSTPSQPIHCIVWAKSYLLPELFGVSEDEAPELDTTTDADNAEEIENLRQEAQALKSIRASMGSDEFAKQVFDKVFKEDIDRLRGMEDMWKTRKPPTALQYDTFQDENATLSSNAAAVTALDQKAWDLQENFMVFGDSLQRLSKRLQDDQAASLKDALPTPAITFDKDDEDTLDFVAACANLRSIVFGIEPQSKFDIKQMAGNIIPAIATTNAMTAGLCVLEALKVMRGDYFRAKMVFLERSGARAVNSESLRPPNPDCAVCGVATSRLEIDPARATIKDLVDDVLKNELEYGEELTIMNEVGPVYDQYDDDNIDKKFAELDIKDGSFLTVVDDDEENPRVNLQLAISSRPLPEESKPVVLLTKPEIARKPKRPGPGHNGATNGEDVEMMNGTSTAKRKRSADDAELAEFTEAKKAQLPMKPSVVENETIVLEDTGDGAIVIDD